MTMIWWWLAWWLKNWRAWRNKLKLPKARCWRPRTAANPKSKVSSQRKPEWVNRQLVLLKAHLPDAGCRTIALTFNRVFAHHEISVSKSYVHRALREQAHAVWQARRAMRSAQPRDCSINHCWALDMTGRADASGTVHQLLGIVDHGSRRLLALNTMVNKCGWMLLGHLCLTVAEYGKPRFVRTDNERCFTGRVFTSGLKLLGIEHQRIDLHCPWQNGRIERLFGTLKDKLRQIVLADGKAINLFLCDFQRWYNEIRPHQNLQGRTPLEAWNNVDPFHAPSEPKEVRFVEGWGGLLSGFHIRW